MKEAKEALQPNAMPDLRFDSVLERKKKDYEKDY